MSAVLADIGGTHARFAVLEDGLPAGIRKYNLSDFESPGQALDEYGAAKGLLYIATAAWPHEDGVWRFAREGRWAIEKKALADAGWDLRYIGNDFGAGARGALALTADGLHEIQAAGKSDGVQKRAAVLGSGTGLGLAYVSEGRVHETYGGQMDVPYRSDEQHMIVKLVLRLKDNDRPVSAEDIISGPGLVLLYKAACLIHGQPVTDILPEALLQGAHDVLFSDTLRLYHEFLGLFAHQAVIYGHAYQALYLDGGVLHRLIESGLFDTDRFLQYYIGDPLPIVKSKLQAMKVNIVTDQYVALKGLAEMIKDGA